MGSLNLSKQTFNTTPRFFMFIAIYLGAFISHFTAGVVNVSLPQFVTIFHTSLGTVQWITTGYLLVIASLLPVMGKLGDRYGYRLIHNLGLLLFSISSVLVAISPTITALLIFRMVQAIGAAMFQSTNIALITIHVPKENRGRALGTLSTFVALGGMIGPIAGGFIAQWFSWQWLFLTHVPITIIATWLAFRYIPVSKHGNRTGPLDIFGAVTFVIAIGFSIFAISMGSTLGWRSLETISLLAVGMFTLATFLLWELRHSAPFLPIKAFRIPAVTSGLIVSVASFMFANTVIVTVPFYLLRIPDILPSTVGIIMIAYPVLLAFTGPVAGHLSDRFGSNRLMFAGLFTMGSGLAIFALYPNQLPITLVIAALALVGLGMGLIASPNNSFIMQHAEAEHIGSIGGMIALTRNMGMVIGAALGLGFMNGVPEQGQEYLHHAFRSVFQINVLFCIGVTIMLGYYAYNNNPRRSQHL
ncbi:MFS transporter [Paenibacillus sp. N3/727]|uniref:MFS transporter n=1 Tax=Paenibacillus sp. N3/727 TaxID=2925845 RepID=UPI001F52C312|nr:MFS transporter [Paenibacillus sp. N3/727]UNK18387.1 MFS transporter [Paenibacillus sp. N3/727]